MSCATAIIGDHAGKRSSLLRGFDLRGSTRSAICRNRGRDIRGIGACKSCDCTRENDR